MTQINDIVGREIKQGDTVVAMAWGWTGQMEVWTVTGFTKSGNVKVIGDHGWGNRTEKTWAKPKDCVVVTRD